MIKKIKTYLSRRNMRNKLASQMRPISDVIAEMNASRERYLTADRIGSNEKNYYKGRYDLCKWLLREK